VRRAPALAACLLAALAITACESNQSRSAQRQREARAVTQEASALDVSRPSSSIEARRSVVVTADGSAAVAVELHNRGGAEAEVPVLVDVHGGGGRSVYRNDAAGLQESLQHVGTVGAGATVWWVNDQVQGGGDASTVTTRVGAGRAVEAAPTIGFGDVRLESDSDGVYLAATATNASKVPQTLLPVSAVALKDGEVVAAGRALIPSLPASGFTKATFRIVFVGDPRGATYQLSAAPKAG
jgi:hypothetical protein